VIRHETERQESSFLTGVTSFLSTFISLITCPVSNCGDLAQCSPILSLWTSGFLRILVWLCVSTVSYCSTYTALPRLIQTIKNISAVAARVYHNLTHNSPTSKHYNTVRRQIAWMPGAPELSDDLKRLPRVSSTEGSTGAYCKDKT
jgi:hypothetical protein